MSEHILPLGLAILLAGALSSGCKGATADLFAFPDAAPGSSGGSGTGSGTTGSLMPGASSSGGQSNPGPGTGGDDAAAANDGGDDAQVGQVLDASQQGDVAPEAAPPADDSGSLASSDEGGNDAPGASDDAPAAPDSPAATPDAGTDGLVCANLGCFDFFDCAIFHPAEVGPCGFTKCVNLICQ